MTEEEKKRKEHDKQLEREHQLDMKQREKHIKQLNREHDSKLRNEEKLDKMVKNIKLGGTGKHLSDVRAQVCQRSLGEMKDLKWQGLGRDVHDFLTARQHGWDRASGSGGFGSGDRMP